MAYIEQPPRENKDGTLSYRVRWRKGGGADGKREGETFRDLTAAEDFRDAVTRAGDEWPWGYVPGIGWDHQAYAALLDATEQAPKPEPITFRKFAEDWANGRTKAQANTRASYLENISAHMNPVFGDADISDEEAISEDTVNKWVIGLLKGANGRKPLKPGTVHKQHMILSSILKTAVRRKLRSTNPCDETELPDINTGAEEDEMVFLTREEFHVLNEFMSADVRDMVAVAVNTGLRFGELTALQVRDVRNLLGPKPYLRIQRAWKRQEDNSWELGPPKSRRSRRNVSVNRAIALILVGLIAGKKQDDYLFLTPRGKVWRHNYFYDTRWRPGLYRAIRCEAHRAEDDIKRVHSGGVRNRHLVPCGCPGQLEKVPRIHDMRHTHASWLIADGAGLNAVQKRLGHQNVQTTERYVHLLPEVDDALVAALEAGWNRTLPKASPVDAKQALAA